MLRFIICLCLTVLISSTEARSEDKIAPVLEHLDDLVIRVETGIALNTYAEDLAQMKINYKKAAADPSQQDNPLLSSRMKEVMKRLDDYAKTWKWHDVDEKKFIAVRPDYVSDRACTVRIGNGTYYELVCLKGKILEQAKDSIARARTAHFDGW